MTNGKKKGGRVTIIAHVGVGIPSHPKMLRIPKGRARGEALGCWLAATCYSRDEELDGWCPAEALEAVSTPETRSRLVEVGLFEAKQEHGVDGYFVVRYADFNETKAEITERLAKDRRRKTPAVPDYFRTDSDRNPSGTPPHLDSISGKGKGNGISSDLPEGMQGGPLAADSPPRPTNLGFLGAERGWWTDAMRAATKNPGYVAPSPRDLGQLLEFVHAGAPGANAAESERWLREAVTAFVAATSTRRKFYPLDKLSGFARWIADNRPTREQLDARDTVATPTTAYEATARARADTGYTAPALGPSDATFRKQRAEAVPMPPMNLDDIFRPKTNPDPEPTEGAA